MRSSGECLGVAIPCQLPMLSNSSRVTETLKTLHPEDAETREYKCITRNEMIASARDWLACSKLKFGI